MEPRYTKEKTKAANNGPNRAGGGMGPDLLNKETSVTDHLGSKIPPPPTIQGDPIRWVYPGGGGNRAAPWCQGVKMCQFSSSGLWDSVSL